MKKLIIIFLLSISFLPAQFKYSVGTGIAFSWPDFTDFNKTLSDSGISQVSEFIMPISYDFSVKIYPSLRVGYYRFSTSLFTYNKSSHNFRLVLKMNGIGAQTYFTFFKRFEADFGIVPMLGKYSFYQHEVTAVTTPFQFSTTTKAGIDKSFFAYYSWIGLRMHLKHYLALEGKLGFMKSFMGDGDWKSESGETKLKMSIDMNQPVYQFGVVLGW